MKEELFSIVDLGIGGVWFLLLLFIGYYRKSNKQALSHYTYFMPNLLFKLLFGLLFAAIYVFYYGGGDTTAYWEGAVKLNNLFWDNPPAYFTELFTTPSSGSQFERFNLRTGYPPSWIYKEPESWFVCKIASIFTFFTFNSYLAITFIFGYISALASWRLFELVRSFNFLSDFQAAASTLFIPTVAVWCSGISKDTIILVGLFFLLYHVFAIFSNERKLTTWGVIVSVFYMFILYHIRPFMLIAIFPPLFLAFGTGIVRKFSDSVLLVFLFRGFIIFTGLLAIFIYFQTKGSLGALEPESYLEEAAIIQQDFAKNHLYTGKRYDLGITDYSLAGMLRAAPAAVIAAFYRPFIWESNSAFLLVSGLESALLMWLTIKFLFFNGGLFRKINQIRKNEFLTFAVLFAIFFGFSVGFTAILFGVLVRFKAPILPFLFVLLLSKRPADVRDTNNGDNHAPIESVV